MKKTTKISPLKHFNDALAKRKTNLQKAQYGTAFQSYLKNVPNATPSDTLGGNDPRTINFGYPSQDAKTNAQAAAFQATYGNTHAKTFAGDPYEKESNYRVPQNKKSVKAYTKNIPTAQPSNTYSNIQFQKNGGPIKSKSIEVHKEGWKNDTVPSVKVKQIPSKRTGIYDYKTGKEIVYTTAGPKLTKKHGGATKAKKK